MREPQDDADDESFACDDSQAKKRKGKPPLRELALSSDIQRSGSASRSQRLKIPVWYRAASLAAARPVPSVIALVAQAFLVPSHCIQFPDCLVSTVAGSPDDPRPLSSLEDFSSVDLDIRRGSIEALEALAHFVSGNGGLFVGKKQSAPSLVQNHIAACRSTPTEPPQYLSIPFFP
jgi:hypothetical protein